ncbi:MAG: hypothetical protein AMS17_05710, partial [Spirochaetes bacterium DG_61]
ECSVSTESIVQHHAIVHISIHPCKRIAQLLIESPRKLMKPLIDEFNINPVGRLRGAIPELMIHHIAG